MFLLPLLFSNFAFGEIEVAFFSTATKDGKIIQFEPNGRFSHVAISYKGQWLHADQKKGVVVVHTLEEIGHASTVLANPTLPDLTDAQVSTFLGNAYDPTFSWRDDHTTYCSKLVGNLLDIEPSPMKFSTRGWSGIKHLPKSELGLSPDDIYAALLKRNFRETFINCNDLFRGLGTPDGRAL